MTIPPKLVTSISQGGVDALKIGVTIAIRYACARPQFGNKTIMSYLTHMDRLFPVLANTYALHLAMGSLKDIVDMKQAKDAKLTHVISSGLKVAISLDPKSKWIMKSSRLD